MNAGDVFYTKYIRSAPASKTHRTGFSEASYSGHIIGIAIGHVAKDAAPPSENLIRRLVGACGLVAGDDIIEAFGEEAYEALCDFTQAKYPPEQLNKETGK